MLKDKIIYFSCIVYGSSFYFAVLLPVCLILAINFVVLARVMISLHKEKKENVSMSVSPSKRRKGKSQTRIATTFATLLGLTWSFAALFLIDNNIAKEIFQTLFSISNSLQGFLLFIFYTFLNEEVRKEWKRMLSGLFGCKQDEKNTPTSSPVTTLLTNQAYPTKTHNAAIKTSTTTKEIFLYEKDSIGDKGQTNAGKISSNTYLT